jgi:F-type H+-transporting ATPase subunit gamma
MRKAQSQALASRPYSRKLQSTLITIAALAGDAGHPLLDDHGQGREVVLLVSTDKSLAGSLNSNLFRGTLQYLENLENPQFIIAGQKARRFVIGTGRELIAEFNNIPDPVSYLDSLPISNMIIDGFISLKFKSVHIVYMDFITTLVQKVRGFQLLPLTRDWQFIVESAEEALEARVPEKITYLFEPSDEKILAWLLPYYIELIVYQVLVEARASEHSARMVSMKNASDNATDIIEDLTLSYNKARQAGITAELLDNITASLIVKQ